MEKNIPISTQWLLESSDSVNKKVIESVFLVYCSKTNSKGTGFVIIGGYIITNWHVIKNCNASDVVVLSSSGEIYKVNNIVFDVNLDLAILTLESSIKSELELCLGTQETEIKVQTWGYPLAYNGPSPILSVGYIAGFIDFKNTKEAPIVKRYIINGALNPGNSGGPLLLAGTNKIIGIVVAKHAPIPNFLLSALEVLEKNKNGLQYNAVNEKGENISFAESQIVAALLKHQRELTQVMLGEAIVVDELVSFLKVNNISI